MARFFVPSSSVQENTVIITGSDVKHITKVLRLVPGDSISIVADQREFAAVIREISAREVICEITGEMAANAESPVEIHLFQGLPKGEKMELIIQKSTELGVSRIVPVICERTVVKLDQKKSAERVRRWQKVAEEAAKQSRRSKVPDVAEPLEFAKALELLDNDCLALLPWEQETARSIKDLLLSAGVGAAKVAVFIGPEGGFAPQEVEQARAKGVIPVTLGPRILRTETAGMAAVAVVQYQLGDLGGVGHR